METITRYPNLMELLRLLSSDNGMSMKEDVAGALDASGTPELEVQAASLSKGEKELFATGSLEEMAELVVGRPELDAFLVEAFDGDLNEQFYS